MQSITPMKLSFHNLSGKRGGVSPPAIIHGQTGCTWGLTTESGIICQSHSRGTSRERKMVKDEIGNVALSSMYNPSASYSYHGYIRAAGGGDWTPSHLSPAR